jgi:hypothetical protein
MMMRLETVKGWIYVALMCALTCVILNSCSESAVVPDGYWRFDPPVQARILNKTVIRTEAGQALVLTYFAGPLLNSGVNTEMTQKSFIGNLRCGHLVESENGLVLRLDMRYDFNGAGASRVIDEIYPVEFATDGSLLIDGLMKYPEIPYVMTEELSNEEALVFQQYSKSCETGR